MKIFTNCDPKPIPNRNFDWSATLDEHTDEDSIIGHGSNELAAAQDLIESLTALTDKDYVLELHAIEVAS